MTREAEGQEQMQMETGLNVLNVENIIILPRTIQDINSRKSPVRPNATIKGHKRTGQYLEVVQWNNSISSKEEIGQVIKTNVEGHLIEVDLTMDKIFERNIRRIIFRGGGSFRGRNIENLLKKQLL